MNALFSINRSSKRHGFSLGALALAAIIGVYGAAGSTAVHAQATAGDVFGKAPAGDTVTARSMTNGVQREVHVDAKGRYAIRSLPIGIYTVTLAANGQPVAKHVNVPVVVGRGVKVDFDCTKGECGNVAAAQ
jgi:hypothetical protein